MEAFDISPPKKQKIVSSNDTTIQNTVNDTTNKQTNEQFQDKPMVSCTKVLDPQEPVATIAASKTAIDNERTNDKPEKNNDKATRNNDSVLASTSVQGVYETNEDGIEDRDKNKDTETKQNILPEHNTYEVNRADSTNQAGMFYSVSSDASDDDDDDGDKMIKILDDVHLDDREPGQNQVIERILFCDSCSLGEDTNIADAKCVCFECEQYLCNHCSLRHDGHLMINVDHDKNKNNRILKELIKKLNTESDDELLGKMDQDVYFSCGRIDARNSKDTLCIINSLCVSKDGKKLISTDGYGKSINLFNLYSHRMTRSIKLSASPFGVTEIPHYSFPDCYYAYFDIKSDSLYLAVSFPMISQILTIALESNNARILYPIQLSRDAECREVFYCNGYLVTYCSGYDPTDHTIKVFNTSGMQIWKIDILQLPGPGFTQPFSCFNIAVHEKSETIYIASSQDKCIVSVNIVGMLVHAVNTETVVITPRHIHVDCDQNVFVSSMSAIYKLTADLTNVTKCVPFTVSGVNGFQVGCSSRGKLYCVGSSLPRSFVTICQTEPSFFSYDQIINI